MDCPHCGKSFHDVWSDQQTIWANSASYPIEGWKLHTTTCPACLKLIIDLTELHRQMVARNNGQSNLQEKFIRKFRVVPANTYRKPTPSDVPEAIKQDYEDACRVLDISAKASAALSRRCLQTVLREQGYSQKDLSKQIEALLAETDARKSIPTGLHQTVDAIRNFGNFSAHPITDQTTLQIVNVDPGEAEWCLDILEEMFDHYYVKPALADKRKAALDAKLAAAGKPAAK